MAHSMPRSHQWRLGVLFALLAGLLTARQWRQRPAPLVGHPAPFLNSKGAGAVTEAQAQVFLALENQEREADATVWRSELEAQRHEDVFHTLWNSLNRAPEPLAALQEFDPGALRVGSTNSVQALPHGIQKVTFTDAATNASAVFFDAATWRTALVAWRNDGWRLGRTRWDETAFRPSEHSRAATSTIAMTAELLNETRSQRAILRGELFVTWKAGLDNASPPVPGTVSVRNLRCLVRSGRPVFEEIFQAELNPLTRSGFVDPMLLHDLNGDGLSEIILVGANRVFWNDAGTFRSEPLTTLPEGRAFAALVADFNGDGHADLLLAAGKGLWLCVNDGRGHFPGPGEWVWTAAQKLQHPQTITAGDTDGDGDLDLWLTQYKLPYQGGQFPTPYFDANDGFPSFLLRNESPAGFMDITQEAGLATKRGRRTYSASFVDLDGDGDLDLVNISDFSGVDLYTNDGHGRFLDRTENLGDARHLFGMAHAVADINFDELPDLFAMGMNSPTATRLDTQGIARPGLMGNPSKRAAMTYGNRLFLGSPDGLRLAPFAARLAHAGWAWGVSLFDFDNDGFLDAAIASGHETGPNVKDYERQFWLHDIFVAGSTNDPATSLYYGSAHTRRVAEGASYGGWQSQGFFMNTGGFDYEDVSFLLGTAIPEDAQNLAADDVDGDGRLDLIFATFSPWPERRPRLRVLRNTLPDAGHWIGLRLDNANRSWMGARVRLVTARGVQTRWLITGDSYRSQHAPAAHFGLGDQINVEKLEILWPDGTRSLVQSPIVDRWNQAPKL